MLHHGYYQKSLILIRLADSLLIIKTSGKYWHLRIKKYDQKRFKTLI